MKRTKPQIDPLEETMENPDLPPVVVAARGVTATPSLPARRALRVTLAVGAVLVVLAVVGLRLVG